MEIGELIEDAIGNVKRGLVYAKKGDEVKIISENEEVVIVESKTGERFPVKKQLVKIKMKTI